MRLAGAAGVRPVAGMPAGSWAGAQGAELYLRLLGEECALAGYSDGEGTLSSVASALVAVGKLDLETANAVVIDYQLVGSLRGRGLPPKHWLASLASGTPGPPVKLSAARVVACEQELPQPWGALRVHYVALGDRSTRMAVDAVESPAPGAGAGSGAGAGPPRSAAGRRAPRFGGVAPAGLAMLPAILQALHGGISLADDLGTTETANFSGGGGSTGWQGALATISPLSASTAWIDLPGGRLELGTAEPDGTQNVTVKVEELAPCGAAERWLWNCLGTARPDLDIDAAAEALVAAGAIEAEGPALAQVRAVASALKGGPQTTPLPLPWAKVAGPGVQTTRRGPRGSVALGTVTPPVDGVTVAMDGLVSREDGFSLDVASAPNGIAGGPWLFGSDVGRTVLAWWAEDDRGNCYWGHPSRGGGGPELWEACLEFGAPLDPRAQALRLMPTGPTQRAVVTVKLPKWGKPAMGPAPNEPAR